MEIKILYLCRTQEECTETSAAVEEISNNLKTYSSPYKSVPIIVTLCVYKIAFSPILSYFVFSKPFLGEDGSISPFLQMKKQTTSLITFA